MYSKNKIYKRRILGYVKKNENKLREEEKGKWEGEQERGRERREEGRKRIMNDVRINTEEKSSFTIEGIKKASKRNFQAFWRFRKNWRIDICSEWTILDTPTSLRGR